MKKSVRGFCAALTATAFLVSATPSVEAGIDWGNVLGSVIGTAINNSSGNNNGGNNGGNNGDLLGGLSNQSHAHKNPNQNERLFMLAVEQNDLGTVQSMLNAGVDINGVYAVDSPIIETSTNGVTAFMVAVSKNNRDMMQFLLENGADVRGYYQFNNNFEAYIVSAAYKADLGLLEYLHNWGADINLKSSRLNDNALNRLMERVESLSFYPAATYDCAKYLVDNGINIDNISKSLYGSRPFITASRNHLYDLVDLFADNGANINIKDTYGKTAMDIAIDRKDLETVKYLQNVMARGQQPSKYQEAKTASDAAAVKNKEVVSYSKHITKAMIAGNEAQDLLNNAGVPVQQIPLQDRVKIAKKMLGKLNESIKIIDENKLQLTKCTPEEKEKMTSWENGVKSLSMKQREYVMILAENRELTHEDYEQVISYMEEANNIANSNYDLLVAAQNYFHVKF
ncbi:ankyrin repeat domain-containing protein [Anaerovibrio sp. RM50]|uniref:ankyrin repeat domain-containing protein n=1 Tax=Anaerovibrio sp. RM50 TaxID=1200557 RepID=UPI0004880DBE|nr:ankyrin repeat domain-containing protein [Anaerovibrio sp. RM50]